MLECDGWRAIGHIVNGSTRGPLHLGNTHINGSSSALPRVYRMHENSVNGARWRAAPPTGASLTASVAAAYVV